MLAYVALVAHTTGLHIKRVYTNTGTSSTCVGVHTFDVLTCDTYTQTTLAL